MAGLIPLIESSKRGNVDQILDLIRCKHKVNRQDGIGCTSLHWAAGGGHYDAVEVLIENGANVNVANNAGDTPLHKAAWKNHASVVELLLKHGADRNVSNSEGKTPLDLARVREVRALVAPAIDIEDDDEDWGQEDEDSD